MGRQTAEGGPERPLRIRAHHLLCILGFRGLGYSEGFVSNMRRVVERLRSQPEAALEIIDSEDCICTACPHNSSEGCVHDRNFDGRTRKRDAIVFRRLDMTPGAEITVGSVYDRIKEHFTPDVMREEVCPECEWERLGHCVEGLEKLRTSPRD